MKDEVNRVLSWYPIDPIHTEDKGKVIKVEAKEGLFALKATKLKEEQAERFFQTLRFFEKQQVPTVLPIILTVRGDWYCLENGRIYYLMPWVSSCIRLRRENDYFKSLALFHRYTERKVKVEEQSLKELGEHFKRERDQQLLTMESYADEIEKKRYFSPFDLSFLMHFPLLYRLHKDSLYWYDKWQYEVESKEQMKVVRCHGNPAPEHLVYDRHGGYRWINLEYTADGHPKHDIACLYKACVEENLWEPVQPYSWITSYKDHVATFNTEDESLLKSELCSEFQIYSFIEKARKRKPGTEHIWTYRLERQMLIFEKLKETVNNWPDSSEKEE